MDPRSSNRHSANAQPSDPRSEARGTSVETLMNYLRDMDYPAPRNKLVAKAIENGAPAEVLERISSLPETADFRTADEVRRAYGGG